MKLKCIDTHQHFWEYNPQSHTWISDEMSALKRDFLPSDLENILNANDVDGCIAVQADQSEAETDFLLALANDNDFIKGIVGWVDLQASNIEECLESYASHEKLLGFRHIVQSEPDPEFMLKPSFMNGISLLRQYGYTYDILIYQHQLKSAIALAETFPEQKFVLDHIAKPNIKNKEIEQWQDDIDALAKSENVSVKISGMVTEAHWKEWKEADFAPYMDIALNSFGTKRIMFGSDWPVCLTAAEYAEVKNIFTKYISSYSIQEQEDMLFRNAINFYNLKL
ncbi:MAG: L-fuconolactonase [Saprospiraceae bacterium]